ncbi:hypothetical protein ACU6U9_19315 [Pseudomonas sp. HK3]|jgi:hypothetical protein
MIERALVIWLIILVMAIANGILREVLLVPWFGQDLSFTLSGILLCALILMVIYLMLPWLGIARPKQYCAIGFGWLFLTLVFEFTLGYFIQNKPLSQILDAYTFKDGNIWPIVLLVTAFAPYIVAKIRRLV